MVSCLAGSYGICRNVDSDTIADRNLKRSDEDQNILNFSDFDPKRIAIEGRIETIFNTWYLNCFFREMLLKPN
jgi:hypothetical protein